jgi:mono/diheme cytochrome c family protein
VKRLALLLVCSAIAIVAQTVTYIPDPKWTPPPDAAAKANPLAGHSEAAAGGGKLFQRHCAECHASDAAGGKKKNAPSLTIDDVQRQSDGALFWKITNGKADGDMPSFSRLPELQRWQLVLHLRTLKSGPSR